MTIRFLTFFILIISAFPLFSSDGESQNALFRNPCVLSDQSDSGLMIRTEPAAARQSGDPDRIVGIYEVRHQGEHTKVSVTKDADGTYKGQVIWVEERLDEDGNVRLDDKNPDRSLRHVECDKIVLFSGLKYEPSKDKWSDAKLYDPTRGIRANMTCEFEADGKLKVKGSLLGFSQSIYWIPLEK